MGGLPDPPQLRAAVGPHLARVAAVTENEMREHSQVCSSVRLKQVNKEMKKTCGLAFSGGSG